MTSQKQPSMFTVSVVIPSLNSPLIASVIAHLKRQTRPPDEIIVVGRDTLNKLDLQDPAVTFIDTVKPINSWAARNVGACQAKGDIIFFIDADGLAAPDWIERLLEHHAQGAEIVGGGVIVPRSGYWTLCDNLVGFTDFLDSTPPGERPHLPTLNFSIRRLLYLEFGGLNETDLNAGQDAELCFRLRRSGYRLWFEPGAGVMHCPSRHSLDEVRAHLYLYGATYRDMEHHYRDVIGGWSWRVILSRTLPGLALLLSPGLALLDTLRLYARYPGLRRYWYAVPGFVVAQQAWYLGLIHGIQFLKR